MNKRMIVLSLGAGVQSTTLALMATHGEFADPPSAAIFADTQWEPAAVYAHLEWLKPRLSFPVYTVTIGDIRADQIARRNTTGGRFASVPWFTVNQDGTKGMGRRQCTSEYKLTPIMRKLRELLGVERRGRIQRGLVEQWIGISTDEVSRMKPARQQWITNRWPLVERGMSRHDCEMWLLRMGYPIPPKSACVGCPFHSQADWRRMRDERPDEFADAVALDAALRATPPARGSKALEYMHPARVPLAEAVERAPARSSQHLFDFECEGMCGV